MVSVPYLSLIHICGNSISLYNKKYDEKLWKEASTDCFNQAYIDDFYEEDAEKKNNIMILNFGVKNLEWEYK